MKVGGEWNFDEYDDAYAMWKYYRDEAEVGGGRVFKLRMPNLHQIRWQLRVSLEMFFFV